MAWSTGVMHGRLARVMTGGTATDAAGTYVDYTSDWSINWARDVATVQRQGQDYKETFGGQAGWTGTVNFAFVRSSVQSSFMGLAVSSALNPASVVTGDVSFCFGSTGERLEGQFWVTGYSVSAPVGDVIRASLSISGNGAVEFSSVHA